MQLDLLRWQWPPRKIIFVFCSERIKKYWVFPSEKLVELFHQNKRGKNSEKYSINLAGYKKRIGESYSHEKFSKYENNFGLLEDAMRKG